MFEEKTNQVANFLKDNQRITCSISSYTIFKDEINHRFSSIYVKDKYREENVFSDNDYSFCGYYDSIDKVIYNSNYTLLKMIEGTKEIKISYFEKLQDEIFSKVNLKLIDYAVSNSEELKNKYRSEFLKDDGNWFATYDFEVKRAIVNDDLTNLLSIDNLKFSHFSYLSEEDQKKINNNTLYNDYLDTKESTVEKLFFNALKSESLIKKMGFNLLELDYKKELSENILNNKDSYPEIFLSQDILKSIKDVDAKELNITITYDNEDLTFKFDKSRLEYALKRSESSFCDWGKRYDNVKEFLKSHKDGIRFDEFDVLHITNITYGKNTLYSKESVQEQVIINNDLDYFKNDSTREDSSQHGTCR